MNNSAPTPQRVREISKLIPGADALALAAIEDLQIWADRLAVAALATRAIKWIEASDNPPGFFVAVDEATERILGYVEPHSIRDSKIPMFRWYALDQSFLTIAAAKDAFAKRF